MSTTFKLFILCRLPSSIDDSKGEAIDQNSFYAKFMRQLRKDWDIIDEGPMEDLLGIECTSNPDGSITLHHEPSTSTP